MKSQFLKHFNKLEKIITILILLYSGGAWLFRPPYFETIEYGIGSMATPINLGIYAVTALFIILRWKHFIYALTKEKLLIITILLALFSVVWSVSPESTMNLNKGLVRVTAFGIYIAIRYSLKEQINILAWTFGLAAVASLLYSLIFPNLGIQPDRFGGTEGWRGVFFHKNELGRQMSFGTIIFLLLALKKSKHDWLLWTLFGLSFSLLLLSNSKTALLCFFVSVIWMFIFPFLRKFSSSMLFILSLTIFMLSCFVTNIVINLKFFLNALGKDMTFTGRVPAWTFLLEKLAEKPWLGYGHDAFWEYIQNDPEYKYSFHWVFSHAHNGFLDVALSIGIIGVLLFALSFLITYFKAIVFARYANTVENSWPLLFFTIIFSTNLFVESTFLDAQAYWMLYVATVFSMSIEFDCLTYFKNKRFMKYE